MTEIKNVSDIKLEDILEDETMEKMLRSNIDIWFERAAHLTSMAHRGNRLLNTKENWAMPGKCYVYRRDLQHGSDLYARCVGLSERGHGVFVTYAVTSNGDYLVGTDERSSAMEGWTVIPYAEWALAWEGLSTQINTRITTEVKGVTDD